MLKKKENPSRPSTPRWNRMVSGSNNNDNNNSRRSSPQKKLVNDLRKMTDRPSLNSTTKLELAKKEENRLGMFTSDLTAAFQLMLKDIGVDNLVVNAQQHPKVTQKTEKEEEESFAEMFKSDLSAAFKLMLEDTGLDKVVKVPPSKVKYAAVCTQLSEEDDDDEEEEEEETITFEEEEDEYSKLPPPPPSLGMILPMTPQSKEASSERPSLASSDVSSSMTSSDYEYDWLTPKSTESSFSSTTNHRKVYNDIPGLDYSEFYFDLSRLDDE